ncbi:hypothetical protein CMI41_01130 [Candidatus Pacearchaeota archaeon]|nr:hypothetical protein [Candidatus Pacearchaeota archaeon]
MRVPNIRTNFDAKKLPTEEQLELYLSSFNLSSELEENIFSLISNHNYEPESHYRNEPCFPYFGMDLPYKSAIYRGLTDLPSSIELNSHVYPAINHENYLEEKEKEKPILRDLPPMAFTLEDKLVKECQTGSDKKIFFKTFSIKKCRDLQFIGNFIRECISAYYIEEKNNFMVSLDHFNYIQKMNFEEIKMKIQKIREVFPTSNIYIVSQQNHLIYLSNFGVEKGMLYPKTYLVSNAYRSTYHEPAFHSFNSAIFVKDQMRASAEHEFVYKIQRGHRMWNVFVALIVRDGLIMPEDPFNKDSEFIQEDIKDSRWHNLI